MDAALTALVRELSDEELFTRVRAGETALFEAIMRRHNQRLFRVARGIVKDDAEAEDVVQQAYLSALTSHAVFRGDARLSTWLARIVIREALARLEKQRRHTGGMTLVSEASDEEEISAAATPEDRAAAGELGKILEQSIDALPDLYRTVFVLREVEEMSTAEAATHLGLTEEAVRVRLHRARSLLRNSIDDQLGEAARNVFSFAGERCDRVVARVMARASALGMK